MALRTGDGQTAAAKPVFCYAQGTETITGLGSYTAIGEEDVIPGDVNLDGEITIADAVLARNIILTPTEYSAAQRAAADYNEDGMVDEADVTAISRLVVGLPAGG